CPSCSQPWGLWAAGRSSSICPVTIAVEFRSVNMALPIHDELAQLSKTNPAGYISTNVFRHLTLKSLLTTIDLLKGKEWLAGQGRLSASLRDVVWDQRAVPTVALAPPVAPVTPGTEVDVPISPGFDVFVET